MADGSHAAPEGPLGPGNGRLPGLKPHRIALAITGALTLWFLLAIGWDIFRLPGAGHENLAAARAIILENMSRWNLWGPVRDYSVGRPSPDQYYSHHPYGTFWVFRLFSFVLGTQPWAGRIASLAMSVAVPPMLFGIGRRLWGLWPGVLCAAAYVFLPITLAFGDIPGFEIPLNFAVVLFVWGYVGLSETWRGRWRLWAALSLLGALLAANFDWEALIFLGLSLGALAAAAWFLPVRVFGAVNQRRFGGWWAIAVAFAVCTVLGYFIYLYRVGQLTEMLAQEAKRSRGNDAALADVLKGDVRSYWIDVTFTPVAVTLGKIAAPVLLLRVVFLRRIREVLPLAILAMSVVQYVKFKNGADVHIYWPLPFAPYFALGVGALAASLVGFVQWVLRRFRWRDRRGLVPKIGYGLIALSLVVMIPDALTGLHYSRMTGGRFNEKGRHSWREVDKVVALQWMAKGMVRDAPVVTHSGLRTSWAVEWALHRPTSNLGSVPPAGRPTDGRYFIADLTQLTSADQEKMFSAFHVIVVGQYTVVDRDNEWAPLEAFAIDEREPTAWEWYTRYGVDPVRTIRPDPWETWELRYELGQSPNPPPTVEPSTPDEIRVAHNAAVAAGDDARAQQYRQRLAAMLDPSVATKFNDGTELIGKRYVKGVEPKLELYFLAAGPTSDEAQFDLTSEVEQAWFFTLVPPDPLVKAVGTPFHEPPHIWHKGFLYVDRNEVRHRPGRESFYGQFTARDHGKSPKRLDGGVDTWLLTLD